MKVNFVLWGTDKSGGTRHIFILANGLIKKGYEVTIVSLGFKKPSWFTFDPRIKFFFPEKGIYFNKKESKSFSSLLNGLARKINKNYQIDRIKFLAKNIPEADITIATYYPTAYSVFFGGKGTLFYYIQHYETIFSKEDYESKLADGSYYLPLKKLAVSTWLIKFLEKKSQSSVAYTGAGVDLTIFKPHYKKEKDTILGMIREAEWKGGKELLKAFHFLNKKVPNLKFKIIGNPTTIKKLIKENKIKIKYDTIYGKNGKMLEDKEVAKVFSESKIFIFSSHLEGFGSPPLEAMACGTPPIVTNCGGS